MRYHPILSIALSRKQLPSHRAPKRNSRYRQEPAIFPPFEATRNVFWAIFFTQGQFQMGKEKHHIANEVSSYVPSRGAYVWEPAILTMVVGGKRGMRGDSTVEVPVQKRQTIKEKLPKGVYRVTSQLPFRRSNKELFADRQASQRNDVQRVLSGRRHAVKRG